MILLKKMKWYFDHLSITIKNFHESDTNSRLNFKQKALVLIGLILAKFWYSISIVFENQIKISVISLDKMFGTEKYSRLGLKMGIGAKILTLRRQKETFL